MTDHHHDHAGMTASRLRLTFGLTLAILLVEAGAGWLSHSLALLSDAGHVLTDLVALGLAWFAIEQAKRPAEAQRTYGYHRVGILTAMVNGATLIVIVIFIAIEAARRFAHPEPVQGGLVIGAALVAIGISGFIAMGLRGAVGTSTCVLRCCTSLETSVLRSASSLPEASSCSPAGTTPIR